jgi:WD40 repeat protein
MDEPAQSHLDGVLIAHGGAAGPRRAWHVRPLLLLALAAGCTRPPPAPATPVPSTARPPAVRPLLEGEAVLFLDGDRTDDTPEVAWSPDGATLAVEIEDHRVGLFDARTGARGAVFEAPGDVLSLAFRRDGRALCATTALGAVAWDTASGAQILRRPGWRSLVSPGCEAIASVDPGGAIVVVEPLSGAERFRRAFGPGQPPHPTWGAGGADLLVGSDVLDAATGQLRPPPVLDEGETSFGESPDGRALLRAAPGAYAIFDARTGAARARHRLRGHAAFQPQMTTEAVKPGTGHLAEVVEVAWSRDGALVAVFFQAPDSVQSAARRPLQASVHEVATGRLVVTIPETLASLEGFTADGRALATTVDLGGYGEARLRDARTGKRVASSPSCIQGVVSPDGLWAAEPRRAGGHARAAVSVQRCDGGARWEIEGVRAWSERGERSGPIGAMAGPRMILAPRRAPESVVLWSPAVGGLRWLDGDPSLRVQQVLALADGGAIAVRRDEAAFLTPSLRPRASLDGVIAASPAGADDAVLVRRRRAWELVDVATAQVRERPARASIWSADGALAASVTDDAVSLVDGKTLAPLATLAVSARDDWTFDAHGHVLVRPGRGDALAVHDARSGHRVEQRPFSRRAGSAMWSPHGRFAVVGGELWDVELAVAVTDLGPAAELAFSPDASAVALLTSARDAVEIHATATPRRAVIVAAPLTSSLVGWSEDGRWLGLETPTGARLVEASSGRWLRLDVAREGARLATIVSLDRGHFDATPAALEHAWLWTDAGVVAAERERPRFGRRGVELDFFAR